MRSASNGCQFARQTQFQAENPSQQFSKMSERVTRYISDSKSRYVKPRENVFWPKTGDWCLAAWKQDGVVYKCKILKTLENGNYKAFFPNYGEGEVAWRRVYENLSDVPKDARYEHDLYEEYDLILHKQKMGESNTTANETMIFTTIDNEKVNKEIVRQKANAKSAMEARNRAIIFEAESTSEEEEMEEYQINNEDSDEGDSENDVIIEDSEDDEYEDEEMMQIVVENIRSLEARNYTNPQILEEITRDPPRRPMQTKWEEEEIVESELLQEDIVENDLSASDEERDDTDLGWWFWVWFGIDIDEVLAQGVGDATPVEYDENEEIDESQVQEVTKREYIENQDIDENHDGKEVENGITLVIEPTNNEEEEEHEENDFEDEIEDNASLIYEVLQKSIQERYEEEGYKNETTKYDDEKSGGDDEASESEDMDTTEEEFFSAEEEEEGETTEEPKEIEIMMWRGSIGSYNAPKCRAF